jgi:hypothetical protein
MACRECLREIGLPEGTVVATPEGVVARIGKNGKVAPGSVQKSALAGPSLKDIGALIATMEGDDSAGSAGSYARIDLV